ncbi:hypothetical protein ASG37_16475 [Sphingomonas sp. Leaf407]|nr:hypothetical protein ASE97_16465 [Sphingomonas sp. Leaf42]KQT25027.1 hypothetical protein ASG37_16475 [Sphingomonas sp. Leaf407]
MAKSPLRRKLGLIAGSLETSLYRVVQIIPVNIVRILCLRLLGARVGAGIAVNHGLQVRVPRRIAIGDDVFLAEDVILDGRGGLTIGAHTSINSRAQIWTAQHDWASPDFAFVSAPTVIGDYCWISANVVVLPGVTIGEGTVVAAGSVVTKDLEPWILAAGVPARKIRDRPDVRGYRLDAAANKNWFW